MPTREKSTKPLLLFDASILETIPRNHTSLRGEYANDLSEPTPAGQHDGSSDTFVFHHLLNPWGFV